MSTEETRAWRDSNPQSSPLLRSDIAVLTIAGGLLILFFILINRGIWLERTIWFDRIMGACLVCTGIWFFLIGCGILSRRWRQVGVIPYPVLGAFMILQGIALGAFHVRF